MEVETLPFGAQRTFSVYLCQKKIEQFMVIKYLRLANIRERKMISAKGARIHGIKWPQMEWRYRWRGAVLQQGLEKERVLTGLKTEPGTNGTAAESPENRWHLDKEQGGTFCSAGLLTGEENGISCISCIPAFPSLLTSLHPTTTKNLMAGWH